MGTNCIWPDVRCRCAACSPPMYFSYPPTKVKTVTVEVPVPEWSEHHTIVTVDHNCNIVIKTEQFKQENQVKTDV